VSKPPKKKSFSPFHEASCEKKKIFALNIVKNREQICLLVN